MKRFVIFIILANLFCVGRAQVEVSELDLMGSWVITSKEGKYSGEFKFLEENYRNRPLLLTFDELKCSFFTTNQPLGMFQYFVTSKNILNLCYNEKGIVGRFIITVFDGDNGTMTLEGLSGQRYMTLERSTTVVDELVIANSEKKSVYNLKGEKLDDLEPGINIVKESSGTSKKVVKK